jgi:anti-sigma B factor antagonist
MKSKVVEILELAVSSSERGTLLKANGRITIDSSPALRDCLLAILRERVPTVTIDLTAVPYIDSSGLATLVEALKFARVSKTALRLRLDERPRYVMEVTGLLCLFDATPDTGSQPISGDLKC